MEKYEVRDLYLASYLRAKGLDLIDTRRDASRVFFIFEDKTKAQELLKELLNDKGIVNASSFIKAIQDLKNIIFN